MIIRNLTRKIKNDFKKKIKIGNQNMQTNRNFEIFKKSTLFCSAILFVFTSNIRLKHLLRNLSVKNIKVLYNPHEFIHIRVDVYVMQKPTYNCAKFWLIFTFTQSILILHI